MFIELTHSHSGERIHVRADKIVVLREKEGKTLIIVDEDRGHYVNESAGYVIAMVEKTASDS